MKPARDINRLIEIMAALRTPDSGCPWDLEQDFATIAPYTIEEAYEVADAIARHDLDDLKDELGDLLLQVTFHAQIAADEGRWDIDDVADGLIGKLIHRHPHVFGDVDVTGADEVLVNWEKLKAEEDGGRKGVDEGIPASLPALARAAKVQRRTAGWGFEWRSVSGAVGALREELGELEEATSPENAEEEVGDVLFATVAVARKLGVDPESALRRTIAGFAERYERFVVLAAERGVDVETASEDELRALFREAR